MKNIVILGARGFIGSHLTLNLSNSYSVFSFGSADCDMLNYDSLYSSLEKIGDIDVIIMCSVVNRLKDNSLTSLQKNIKMAVNLALLIEQKDISQLIFLSSIDVYGIVNKKMYTEALPLQPNDYYSMSKVVSEFILEKACRENGVNLFIPRLGGIFGSGDTNKSTIFQLVSSAINTGEIILYERGKFYRDFIFIDYLIELLKNSIKYDYSGIVNIATGNSYTIENLSGIIKNILGGKIKFIYKERQEKERRPSDIHFDISRLKNSRIFVPPMSIENYLSLYIEDFLATKDD